MRISLKNVLVSIVTGVMFTGPLLVSNTVHATANVFDLVSQSTAGDSENNTDVSMAMSDDARYVEFISRASNLDANYPGNTGYTGGNRAVFLRDRLLGTTRLISLNSQGQVINGQLSDNVIMSGNGQYAFFTESNSTNLGVDPIYIHPGYGYIYTFRKSLATGVTELVTIDSVGIPYPASVSSVSYDGNLVTFDGMLRNISTGVTTTMPNGKFGGLSSDGSKVSFTLSTDGTGVLQNTLGIRDLTTNQDTILFNGVYPSFINSSFLNKNGNYVFFDTNDDATVANSDQACQYYGLGCTYRYDLVAGTMLQLRAQFDGYDVAVGDIDSTQVSEDGTKVLVTSGITAADEFVSPQETGRAVLDLSTNSIYKVGYGPNWVVPSTTSSTSSTPSLLSADGTLVVVSSAADNFNNPASCVVNIEGSIETHYCGIYITSATPRPDDVTQTATLAPTADTYVKSGEQQRNEGAETYMDIQSSGSHRSLVKFDTSTLSGHTIISAKLRLTITGNGNNWGTTGRTIDALRMTSDWTEGNGTDNSRGTGSGNTWNCAVDTNIQNQQKDCSGSTSWEMGNGTNPWFATPSATQTITNSQSGVVEFDVTSDVQALANGTVANDGWIIKKTNEGQNGAVTFSTKEGSSAPQLVVTYQ